MIKICNSVWRSGLPFTLAALSLNTYAAITKEPYLLVEEIGITQEDSLENASYEIYPTAAVTNSSDTTYISGAAQAVLSPFRFFDFSATPTYDYGCQYSDEVCDLLYYGTEDSDGDANENGFMYYRAALEDQSDGDYTSYFMAFLASGAGSVSSLSEGDTYDYDTWTAVTEKQYVFDTAAENNTDTRINDLYIDTDANIDSSSYVWAAGYDSDPFNETDTASGEADRDTLDRAFVQRAFLKNLDTGTIISLMPTVFSDDDDADITDDYGGISAAYKIVELDTDDDGTTDTVYAIGQASNAFIDDDPDYWEDCQYDADYFGYCSGYTTQAWAWDITDIISGSDTTTTELDGFALVDGWINEDYDEVNRSAIAYAMNSEGVGVGYTTTDISESVTGGHAQAVTFDCSGGLSEESCTLTKIPGTASESDYDDSEIEHQWAVDINENGIVIGNSRSAEVDNYNKAVEFFVFKAVTDDDGDYDFTDSDGTLSWPLRDKPFDGANSEIKAVNDNNLMVGWRDDEDQDQPSYGGTSRRQAAFLFDYDRYIGDDTSGDDNVWYLNDLICYEEEGEATQPFYRIEYATEIMDDDSIIASGYKYDSIDDLWNKTNPTPVLLKLSVNSSGDLDNLASCPVEEEEDYVRQGAGSSTLLLLLLPFGLIRRFYFKLEQTK
jgi:hypothetical protein